MRKTLFALFMAGGSVVANAAPVASASDLGLSEQQLRSIVNDYRESAPGVSLGSPVGFGLNWGELAASIGGNTISNSNRDVDGSMALAAGLGNSTKAVGLELTYSINSVGGIANEGQFGDEGAFGVKLHTAIPGGAAFAVGIDNVGRYGDETRPGRASVYGVATKVFKVGIPVALNLGAGTNRFTNGSSGDGVGVFGGVTVLPTDYLSLITDYTGRDLNAGVSVAPFKMYPLTVTLGAINLLERRGNSTEFTGAVGYAYRF